MARGGRYLGAIHIGDTLRAEAKHAVEALKAARIRTLLLTGDARPVAEAAARELGVDEVGFELLPEEKAERVKALAAQGRRTAMIGDGVNDAPALVEATVGVAMGSGTDVARESADIVLLGNDLLKFVQTVQIARRTRRIIFQNFTGTLIGRLDRHRARSLRFSQSSAGGLYPCVFRTHLHRKLSQADGARARRRELIVSQRLTRLLSDVLR